MSTIEYKLEFQAPDGLWYEMCKQASSRNLDAAAVDALLGKVIEKYITAGKPNRFRIVEVETRVLNYVEPK